jgi:hypothetical protein
MEGRACWFVPCPDEPVYEAIGTYDNVFGIEETVAMAPCPWHAEKLKDDVVVLEPS